MKKIINILFFTTVMLCIVGCRKDEKIIPEDTRLDELEKAGCIKEYTYSIDSSYKSFLIEYIGGGKFEVILEEMSEEEN